MILVTLTDYENIKYGGGSNCIQALCSRFGTIDIYLYEVGQDLMTT